MKENIIRKAQNVVEYGLLVALVALVFTNMYTYLKRSLQAGLKQTYDQLGPQAESLSSYNPSGAGLLYTQRDQQTDGMQVEGNFDSTNPSPYYKQYVSFRNTEAPLYEPSPVPDMLLPEDMLARLRVINEGDEHNVSVYYQGYQDE
jgi:Flp pilus assembly pilin Flp